MSSSPTAAQQYQYGSSYGAASSGSRGAAAAVATSNNNSSRGGFVSSSSGRHSANAASASAAQFANNNNYNNEQLPAIWATRPVEWPVLQATKLPVAVYAKLLKASRAAGQQLGISSSSAAAAAPKTTLSKHNRSLSATTTATTAGSTATSTKAGPASPESASAAAGAATAEDSKSDDGGAGVGGGGGNYFAGFMSRVLNTTTTTGAQPVPDGEDAFANNAEQQSLMMDQHHPTTASKVLRAPRPGCVAAGNGWIVAVAECPITTTTNIAPTTAPTTPTSGGSSSSIRATTVPAVSSLRLVSRWNVRRGGGAGTDQWIALPPPIAATSVNASTATSIATSGSFLQQQQDGNGRIMHVFVDPTGSHTLISAVNGEAYYIHSSLRAAVKLVGFGVIIPTKAAGSNHHPATADGTSSSSSSGWHNVNASASAASATAAAAAANKWLTGVPATAVAHKRGDAASQSTIQVGLTPHSYVTAVAWDKERGTEGSSKTILLGTSAGEIYEYCLGGGGGGIGGTSSSDDAATVTSTTTAQQQQPPVLLHKLYRTSSSDGADPSEVGAAVTGLYFERLRTGLLVLAATSGRHKRTRLYTFYSAHSSSFRMVLADQQHAGLQELPGSVDFADLRLCNDHFGLRTQTGIYYGTIDRSLSGPAVMSGGSSSMIVDSGILPYEVNSKSGAPIVPVSLALTPHHIVLLMENNEIQFINRVAQKVIQRERVDATVTTTALDESAMGVGEFLMDIRRPDQIFLRKGRSLVHISSSQEDRDVWKFTLQKCLELPVPVEQQQPSASLRFGLTEEEKTQEALFEQAKTLCTNASQKVRSFIA